MPAGRARRSVSREAADADRPDLAFVAESGHDGELVVDVDDLIADGLDAEWGVEPAEIDDRDAFRPQGAQIVLHAGAELLRSLGGRERNGAVGIRIGAHLAHDHGVGHVGQSFAKDAVDETVAVELGCVEVVHAELDGSTDQRERCRAVVTKTFELHGAEADALDGVAGEEPGRRRWGHCDCSLCQNGKAEDPPF
ncbi:hypothetical protein GCM10025867_29770 [Frondihabitans sucicola]|uniref:Uncharacterized protein n=1 Tax=Frondihabitans sucicola TaxID=1268041 RepID=A0ABN6Y124_9MICO|nr:hypothetical protein GCM10025867_29770 [Frondihabitans sucicola]